MTEVVVQKFVSNYAYVIPYAVEEIVVTVHAGGGGNSIAHGGEGGVITGYFRTIALPKTIFITVGKGGNHKEPGGDSSFGDALKAYGGGAAAGDYDGGKGDDGEVLIVERRP